ncbi:MAG: sigma 54-interacting transcriptional regulator [Candidatus Cloacimonas sp.]|jgi:DNA-binding NtrC family response regulator|nr:sigma 54-interacting transcriptional regulator [Candidatus Cloacimonas sp.]
MICTLTDRELYELQHHAINEPLSYINNFVQTSRKLKKYPADVMHLFLARANAVIGETNKAHSLLEELKTSLPKLNDEPLLGKFYLTQYSASTYSETNNPYTEDYFKQAEKHIKQSGSKALSCELKIATSQKVTSDLSLEMKEELLHSAMQDALEAGILDLQLEVHLSYCVLYLLNNLPEPANRELTLLQELLEKEQHPLLYANILLYFGIVNLMLKELPTAQKYLLDGIAWAKARAYMGLLIPLNINLGLFYTNNGNAELGIDTYRYCLKLMQECGLENSLNANRTQDNLARALGKLGRFDEAIQILRTSLEIAKKSGNKLREYIVHVNLADNLTDKEAFEESEMMVNKAIDYFSQINENLYLSIAYRCKARLFEAQEKYQEGFEALEMLDNANQKHFRENFNKQNAQYQARMNKLHNEYLQIKNQCHAEVELNRLCENTDLIGEHASVKKAIKDAMLAARYPNTNVLITGESGTGKEVIARMIHAESKTGKPLVAINASAISANLIESELFGHKRGAFTGAMEDRKGKFLQADKGTLLLDEISDMPVEAQVKLLRAIETHSIQPVGSDKEIPVNCRIISTSNCDIPSLIHANTFRLDLYHRLNKVEIHLLPLRERLSDLELITSFFVQRFSKEFRIPQPTLTENFFNRLREYSFPGNIRELMNILERILILSPKAVWKADQLDGVLLAKNTPPRQAAKAYTEQLQSTEHLLISEALARCNWVQKETAKLLNMSESKLSRRINKLKITKP